MQPLSQLIKSHVALDNRGEAMTRLEEALAANEQHFVAENLIGELHLANEAYVQARVSFEHATEVNEKWAISYRNLAAAMAKQGDDAGAVEVIKRGIEASGGSALLVAGLASYLQRNGDLDSAIEQYESISRDSLIRPWWPTTWR